MPCDRYIAFKLRRYFLSLQPNKKQFDIILEGVVMICEKCNHREMLEDVMRYAREVLVKLTDMWGLTLYTVHAQTCLKLIVALEEDFVSFYKIYIQWKHNNLNTQGFFVNQFLLMISSCCWIKFMFIRFPDGHHCNNLDNIQLNCSILQLTCVLLLHVSTKSGSLVIVSEHFDIVVACFHSENFISKLNCSYAFILYI